ncbi:MAG: LysE family translocator [Acidobacteriota bacterium]
MGQVRYRARHVDPLLLAYLTFTIIFVITPGSTTALVVRNTLIGGRTAGLATAAGAAIGNTSYATASGLGLALLFAQRPHALRLLQVGGAAYLAWLGLVSVSRALPWSRATSPLVFEAGAAPSSSAQSASFKEGLVVNLLSPAVATFYFVAVPSFVPQDPPPAYFVLLAAMHVTLALSCHSAWALGLDRIRRILLAPGASRLLEGATGVALIALAVSILLR